MQRSTLDSDVYRGYFYFLIHSAQDIALTEELPEGALAAEDDDDDGDGSGGDISESSGAEQTLHLSIPGGAVSSKRASISVIGSAPLEAEDDDEAISDSNASGNVDEDITEGVPSILARAAAPASGGPKNKKSGASKRQKRKAGRRQRKALAGAAVAVVVDAAILSSAPGK